LFVAFARVRDLLLRAKQLFAAAIFEVFQKPARNGCLLRGAVSSVPPKADFGTRAIG
jgi:hypothetical protein